MITEKIKWLLLGAFLIIVGIFLPWYYIQYPQEIPWIGIELIGTVYGHTLLFGKILLVLAAIFTTLVLIPENEKYCSRIFLGQMFIGSLIVVLFLFNVLIHPVFIIPYVNPHVGILAILFGCISLTYGLKKAYRDL